MTQLSILVSMIERAVCKDIKLSLSLGEFKLYSSNCAALLWEEVNGLALKERNRNDFQQEMLSWGLWILSELKLDSIIFFVLCILKISNKCLGWLLFKGLPFCEASLNVTHGWVDGLYFWLWCVIWEVRWRLIFCFVFGPTHKA